MTKEEIRDKYGIVKAAITHLESQKLQDGERHIIIWFKGMLPQIMGLHTAREIVFGAGSTDDPLPSMLVIELSIIAELDELDKKARLKSAH